MIIKNRIKYCRNNMEISQTKLGAILHSHKSTVSGWENGYDSIPLTKLVIFCNLYNYSLDYILCLNDANIQYEKAIINPENLANKIKTIRLKNNFTQQKLANELSISQAGLYKYENGKSLPTTMFLYTFAKKFNVSIDLLLDRKRID